MSPRLKDENKEKRRLDILQAAKQVFIRNGYEMTSIQDIANELKVSRGTLYLYFSGKEEIFEELVAQFFGRFIYIDNEGNDTEQSVWKIIEGFVKGEEKFLISILDDFYPVIFEYNTSCYRNDSRRLSLLQRYSNGIEMYTELFKKGMERGEFKPILPIETIAKTYIIFIDGLACDTLHLGFPQKEIEEQLGAFCIYLKHVLNVRGE